MKIKDSNFDDIMKVKIFTTIIFIIMYRAALIFRFGRIAESLKSLSATPPTTHKQIKAKYLQLAKKLHPDTKEEEGRSLSAKQIQSRSEAFIEATKAYKFLLEQPESKINLPQNEREQANYEFQSIKTEPTPQPTPMTPQQKMRKNTYAYFNQRYRKDRNQHQGQQSPKEPLYKQLPQLFLGIFFVFLFLVEWAYTALKRSLRVGEITSQEKHSQVFQNMSYKKKREQEQQTFLE